MDFLNLLDELIDIINEINKKLTFSKKLKEDLGLDLSNLLKISLNIIEDLENHFNDIDEFTVKDINNKIDTLMKSLSITFLLDKKSKSTFTETELQLYNNLLDNLHILSKKSIEFENMYHLGLHTFDRANARDGLKQLEEGFNAFWDEF